jgi:large subunit ribosomal protein L3
MAKRHKPRAGSRAYVPRKRAKKQRPRIRHWPKDGSQTVCGFAGYKAGMTHVFAVDERKGQVTSGMETFIPATVVDAPPMNVVGLRAYKRGYKGIEAAMDILFENPPPALRRALILPKKTNTSDKINMLKERLNEISDIKILVSTQPSLTSIPKKKPDVMEIGLHGDIQKKLEYALEQQGKQLRAKDVFRENSFADVIAVTKGKGFQGIIKRFGVRRQPRKSTQKRRHMGTGGPITPSRKMWFWPTPGQHGYHTRTEYNKAILKIGVDGSEVTPQGGFLRYGPVKGDYIILKGSIPGPAKRMVRLTIPRRQKNEANFAVTHVDVSSKQGAA